MNKQQWSSYHDEDGPIMIAALTGRLFGAGETTAESSAKNYLVEEIS